MYLLREIFNTKPGKAKDLVKKFKQGIPHFEKSEGGKNYRVLTDVTGSYWTVVIEYEIEDIGNFFSNLRSATASPELMEIMQGYMDLVEGGRREVFMIE